MKILLTGGTRGIGLMVSKLLLSEGHELIIVGRNRNRFSRLDLPSNAQFIECDLGSISDTKALIRKVSKKWKKFDVLINNAAVISNKSLSDLRDTDLEYIINTNFLSPALLMKYFINNLGKKGMVVNVLSPAIYRRKGNIWAYSASKFCLMCSSESVKNNINVANYFPGIVRTEMVADKSILSKLISTSPKYTAGKIVKVIHQQKSGAFYEPSALIIKFAGIVGI